MDFRTQFFAPVIFVSNDTVTLATPCSFSIPTRPVTPITVPSGVTMRNPYVFCQSASAGTIESSFPFKMLFHDERLANLWIIEPVDTIFEVGL